MAIKAHRFFGICALGLGLAVFGCGQTRTLTILHTNDMHSAMVPFGPRLLAAGAPLSLSRGRSGSLAFPVSSLGEGAQGSPESPA